MGASEEGWRVLFDNVVSVRRLSIWGRRFKNSKVKSDIDVDAAVGMPRVLGRLRPGNDDIRMLTM